MLWINDKIRYVVSIMLDKVAVETKSLEEIPCLNIAPDLEHFKIKHFLF